MEKVKYHFNVSLGKDRVQPSRYYDDEESLGKALAAAVEYYKYTYTHITVIRDVATVKDNESAAK